MDARQQVYIVDDEAVIANTLASILNDHGFETTSFTDPLEALAVIDSGTPAFLISDVSMPSLTGIELAMKVLERSPICRVVLMSGLDSIDDLLEAAGATEYRFPLLHKPFEPRVLLDAMRNSSNGHLNVSCSSGL